jgi:outer membrane protein assembly factor BamB
MKDGNKKQNPIPDILTVVQWAALVFAAVVGLLLGATWLRLKMNPPLENPALTETLTAIEAQRDNEALREDYRILHFMARRAFFGLRFQLLTGRYLLAAGLGVFFVSRQILTLYRRQSPTVFKSRRLKGPEFFSTAATVFLFCITLTIAGGILSFIATESPGSVKRGIIPVSTETGKNWPSLRGAGGIGITDQVLSLSEWNGLTGKNILWKKSLGSPGFSSPVIWQGTVYISSGDSETFTLAAYDGDTGREAWKAVVLDAASYGELPKVTDDTGYAASTPAADKDGVYCLFATGTLAAYTHLGRELWIREMGMPDNIYGHASSLLCYNGLLYVQYDHNSGAALYALNTVDGKTVWRKDRGDDVGTSWSSPVLTEWEGEIALIVNGNPWLIAYDPLNGDELWRVDCLGGEVAPSSTFAGGVVYAANEYAALTAVDLKRGVILWEDFQGPNPDVSSPVAAGEYLFVAAGYGDLTMYRLDTGEKLWIEEKGAGAYSSPLYLGGRIYVSDKEGITYIINPGESLLIEAENPLGEPILTTPALYNERLYIRGDRHLFCIGTADE